jgi:hypothetical protein
VGAQPGRGEIPDAEVRRAAQSPRLLAGLAHRLGGEIDSDQPGPGAGSDGLVSRRTLLAAVDARQTLACWRAHHPPAGEAYGSPGSKRPGQLKAGWPGQSIWISM